MMYKRFTQKIENMGRLIEDSRSASSRFLLAVSGGMDSMCMADLFLKTAGASSFAIAHCNFSLRGKESDGDEALVCKWAESNGVQVFVRQFDTVSYAREKGISIEMAARELRYLWFGDLCRENNFTALSVAHNANDNAETLMLNLLRGTGLKGLHGMEEISYFSSVPGRDKPLTILRPLLEFTRKQIEGYVLSHRVPYRNDSSNFETDYKRNRIRNEVFPIFEKINPSFIRTFNREIGYFSEAGEIVDDWCRGQIENFISSCPGRGEEAITVDLSQLLDSPHWRYLLYHILEPYGFSSQVLSSLEDLLTSNRTISGKRFDAPGYTLFIGRGELKVVPYADRSCFCVDKKEPASYQELREADDQMIVVRGPGVYGFNGSRLSVEVLKWDTNMPLKQSPGVLVFDAEIMKFPFVCRRWRKGDWFVPFGMKGKKKVSDMFTDLKYDSFDKESAVIVVDTQTEGLAQMQHVAAVAGVRIDDRYKISSITKTVIRVSEL